MIHPHSKAVSKLLILTLCCLGESMATHSFAAQLVPFVRYQPQDQLVTTGQGATFIVAAEGERPLSYEWTLNGARVGTNGPVYTRENCQLSDDRAQIGVKVTNARGFSESLLAKLRVRWGGTNFYISATGSTNNNGLSMASPWPLRHGLAQIGPSNTINLLPGTYPTIRIGQHGITLRSTTKWGAKIVGTPYTHGIHALDGFSDLLVEGIHVAASHVDGIKLGGDNSTVRNCWVEKAGRAHPFAITNTSGLFSGQGISAHNLSGTVIEYNLIEKCGMQLTQDHGMYVNGTNIVIRGNVVRYNIGWGIQVYDTHGDSANVILHNNLIYGNGVGPMVVWSRSGATNYVLHNTLIGHEYCLVSTYGRLDVANNILMAGPAWHPVLVPSDGSIVEGGYNLVNKEASELDQRFPTDLLITDPQFVDPSRGLYGLKSTSPVRGQAHPWGPVDVNDFYGAPQPAGGSPDLGAFTYDSTLETDTRTLDPSPEFPDYWARLEFAGCLTNDLRVRLVSCETNPLNRIIIEFSSPVAFASGVSPTNYTFAPSLEVQSVEPQPDGKTFILTVTALDPAATYSLRVSPLLDNCGVLRQIYPVRFGCNQVVLSSIQTGPGTVLLQWVRPGILQESDSIIGPWRNVSSEGAFTVSSVNSHGFFRLVESTQ